MSCLDYCNMLAILLLKIIQAPPTSMPGILEAGNAIWAGHPKSRLGPVWALGLISPLWGTLWLSSPSSPCPHLVDQMPQGALGFTSTGCPGFQWLGASPRRAAWCPDHSCCQHDTSFPGLNKNGLPEWRWHVGLGRLWFTVDIGQLQDSGLHLSTDPWAWTPATSSCSPVLYHSASWNLPYPREEWGRAAICALCTPTVGTRITPHAFHRLHTICQTLLMSSPGAPETVTTQSQRALPVNVPSCLQSTRGCIALPRPSSAVKYEDRRFLCKWALFLCPQVLCPSCLLVTVCESSQGQRWKRSHSKNATVMA